MAAFFLASIAGLFPRLSLPLATGWKSVHPFDVFFVACLVVAATRRAYRPPDWRLIAATAALVGACGVSLWAHPSPQGMRAILRLAYSMVVFLAVSHLRVDRLDLRVDRVIVGPLFIAVGVAWVVFAIENGLGVPIGRNNPASLPSGVHRFGGLTGANTLILFLCLGAPLAHGTGALLLGVLLPAMASLSRSLLGVGAALIVAGHGSCGGRPAVRRGLTLLSWMCGAAGLFAYVFAVVPVRVAERTSFNLSLQPGTYLTLHVAALRMLQAHPFAGVGPERFFVEYRGFTSDEERHRVFERDVEGWNPHSAILGQAAEGGLLGLSVLGWLIYETFKRLAGIAEMDLRRAAVAGFVGLLVGGFFVDWLALKGLWLWIGLLVASRPPTQGNLPATSP